MKFSLTQSFGFWWWGQTLLKILIESIKLKRSILNLLNNAMRKQHTHLLHIECRAQCYSAALKQITSWEQYHQGRMLSSQWELSPDPDVYLFRKCADLRRVKRWAMWSTHKINQHLPSKQTSARGGKVYPYKGFLNFSSTSSSAFWRLTLSSSSMS